jgi:hypothetical protein
MINILYMGHSRTRYFDYLMKVFAKMRNKSNVRILLLLPGVNSQWESRKATLMQMGFQVVLEGINHGGNYRAKLFRSFDFSSDYTIKIDEDIFCTAATLDYMIDNAPTAITDKNFILTPLLSTGIPTTDRFMATNFEASDIADINKLFLEVLFGHIWGGDYSSLNKHTISSSDNAWHPEKFFETVETLQTCFKGIHPVRLSSQAQTKMNYYVMKNIAKMTRTDFSIVNVDYPYICNSFFMIRTDVWKALLQDSTLWVDLYDEVPLNLYMKRNNKSMAIVENTFVVHPSYNTIGEHYASISDGFYSFIMGRNIS